jgi:hypothetical protein
MLRAGDPSPLPMRAVRCADRPSVGPSTSAIATNWTTAPAAPRAAAPPDHFRAKDRCNRSHSGPSLAGGLVKYPEISAISRIYDNHMDTQYMVLPVTLHRRHTSSGGAWIRSCGRWRHARRECPADGRLATSGSAGRYPASAFWAARVARYVSLGLQRRRPLSNTARQVMGGHGASPTASVRAYLRFRRALSVCKKFLRSAE